MRESFEVLEIGKILPLIAAFAKTDLGKEALLHLRPYKEKELPSALAFQDDYYLASGYLGRLSLGDGRDIGYGLSLTQKGGRMAIEDFLSLASDITDIRIAKEKAEDINIENSVKTFILNLPDLGYLGDEILRIIHPEGRIYDNASPKLKAIRKELQKKRSETSSILPSLVKRYANYLSSNSFAYRDGHYVLPVAISYKNKVKGMLIDLSASEATAFIEPEELLILQNEIAEIEAKEKEEIATILMALSVKVGEVYEDAKILCEGILTLDIAQAKNEFGQSYHGHLCTLSPDGSIFLPGARHPLLDQNKAVPNDFVLRQGAKVVVLSGPNAGGKTVALKTLAVNIILFEMAVPCLCLEGGFLPYFKHVYADIGDSQSLTDNLSTFSGHIANIAQIAERCGGKDIVFLDEIGTGTSPKEGEALAIATLQYLQKKHAYVLVSSHFEGVKAMALENPNFDNASLIYDEEKLLPTYKLRFGSPGESYGLMAAKRFGLQEEILAEAKRRIGKGGQGAVSEAIKKLTKLQKENEALQEQLVSKEEELKNATRKLKIEQDNFTRQKEAWSASKEEEKEAYIASVKEEVAQLVKDLANPDLKLHQAIKIKAKLEELGPVNEEESFNDDVFNVGEEVEVSAYGVEGIIKSITGDRAKIETLDGMAFDVSLSDLKHKKIVRPKVEKKPIMAFVDSLGHSSTGLECNLIGMRVDEALNELDHYLDACILSGYKRVRIIHGFGSGALRKATHEYLKAHKKIVASFELAGASEGGSGATVVNLK